LRKISSRPSNYTPRPPKLGTPRRRTTYENGTGVEKDLLKAVELYTKAAEAAISSLELLFDDDVADEEALQSYYAQANAGDAKAQAKIIMPDTQKAVRWVLDAKNGDATVAFTVGTLYEFGLYVPKDVSATLRMYKKAAAQGAEQATRVEDL
jgi:TPR repeat protein